jgi:F0F1-type ATP synthase assembly protein I
MSDKDRDNFLNILLKQYSECCADIRNFDTLVWQIPTLLVAVLSFLGILYAGYLQRNPIGRITVLFIELGFALVSLVVMMKHRFFCDRRVEHIENYLDEQFKILLQSYAKRFEEVKRKSQDFKESCCIYRTSAYRWQRGLTVAILFGILFLLLVECIRFVTFLR